MKRLGRTDLTVFPLGLGGIPLQKITIEEAHRVIDACLEGGVNFADTAAGYGDSEEKLSRFLRRDRDRFVIASKSPSRSAEGMAGDIDQSLERLDTDYIDIYQVHSLKTDAQFERIFAPGGAMEALVAARDAGKIRFIGVTGHRPSILVKAVRTGSFDTVQAPINLVDRESEAELLPLAREMDVGILAMKPVCGGTLDNPALGIRFCLNSLTDLVLCGMKNEAEVEANLETVRGFSELTAEEEDELLAEASQLGTQFCRRCEYCQPCPQGINIPKILWLANYHRRYAERDPWTEDEYAYLEATIEVCADCGDCEAQCPYDLHIRDMLREADRELTPPAKVVAKRKIKGVIKRVLPGRRAAD